MKNARKSITKDRKGNGMSKGMAETSHQPGLGNSHRTETKTREKER